MAITLESIREKMGCDPFDPPYPEYNDSGAIDDTTPSPYSVLSQEELEFLIEIDKKRIEEKAKKKDMPGM